MFSRQQQQRLNKNERVKMIARMKIIIKSYLNKKNV